MLNQDNVYASTNQVLGLVHHRTQNRYENYDDDAR